ncbi:O-acetyl-ADP-ribose deacetylase [Candidatus Parcubacteria bacterium]|nr:MAG: O-acetyl-ADP-ribose deacetylase [Candidatus Parcubacteria bacterium]
MTKITIKKGDITEENVDTIVNAANESLFGGGGVDGAIHKAAGVKLLEECRTLNGCKTGKAKLTKGYNLKAKYVIHTVGPVWNGGNKDESLALKNSYLNSLILAVKNGIKTIAFPAISTGVYGYPKEAAAKIAIKTVSDFIREDESIDEIVFVLFSENDFDLYKKLMSE